ncbi:MAG: hypothetical protein Q8T09_17490 [Candidatus Melainabacteria bacterium]|nr:hypothetical protein [Candidatus Melainabacteria bacterium]
MSRVLLNHQEVVDFIKKNFVPVSASVEELQPGRYGGAVSAQSKWFEPIAQRAMRQFAPPGFWNEFKTYQGMYVVGANGVVYDYKVGLPYDPRYFLDTLAKALSASTKASLSKSARLNTRLANDRSSLSVDPSTSVVRVYSRILPLPASSTVSERSVGRDHMWIMRREVEEIFAKSRGSEIFDLPQSLVARMVRFHLLNHVGNIMPAFSEKQVKRAVFKAKKSSEGKLLTYSFTGDYFSYAPPRSDDGGEGSMEGTIAGEFDLDKKSKMVVRFRAYGEALSLGRNDSLIKTRKYPVSIAMVEANDPIGRSVIPFWANIPMFAPTYANPEIIH